MENENSKNKDLLNKIEDLKFENHVLEVKNKYMQENIERFVNENVRNKYKSKRILKKIYTKIKKKVIRG